MSPTIAAAPDALLARLQAFDRALTVTDVAELLSTSKSTIERLCNQRQIPHFRVGKLLRFLPSKVADWLLEKQAIVAVHQMLRTEAKAETRRRRAA